MVKNKSTFGDNIFKRKIKVEPAQKRQVFFVNYFHENEWIYDFTTLSNNHKKMSIMNNGERNYYSIALKL